MLRSTVLAGIGACLWLTNISAHAQPQDIAASVERTVAYLAKKGEDCAEPALDGVQPFRACRGEAGTVALIIATELPVRDDDGRIVGSCFATLTATSVTGFSAVKMDPQLAACPQPTIASGEFARIFIRILLRLGDWVVRMEKPA
jgi:hypothetical protein